MAVTVWSLGVFVFLFDFVLLAHAACDPMTYPPCSADYKHKIVHVSPAYQPTFSGCSQTCKLNGFRGLSSINSVDEYNEINALVEELSGGTDEIPVWVGLNVSEKAGIRDYITGAQLQNFAIQKSPTGIYGTVKLQETPQSIKQGPVYLYGDYYARSTFDYQNSAFLCACGGPTTTDCTQFKVLSPSYPTEGGGTYPSCQISCSNEGFRMYAIYTSEMYQCAFQKLVKSGYAKSLPAAQSIPVWTGIWWDNSKTELRDVNTQDILPLLATNKEQYGSLPAGMSIFPRPNDDEANQELGPVFLRSGFYTISTTSFDMRDRYANVLQAYCLCGTNCGSYFCDQKASCVSVSGSSYCQCNTGYTGSGLAKANGTNCQDVNECKTGDNFCGSGLVCQNTVGSFLCMFEGTG